MVGPSLVSLAKDFFLNGILPSSSNDTFIVLITKLAKPECIGQYRPISLCNVFYKVISKVMVNRLKPLMSEIVSPMQSSFIPGRMI